MQINIDIPDSRISDLLHGHGGSVSSWLHSLRGDAVKDGALAEFDREGDEEGAASGKQRFTLPDVAKGLAVMAKESPNQFAQFLQENDDDITFDTAWQCIIFGKLIYA